MLINLDCQQVDITENNLISAVQRFIRDKRFLNDSYINDDGHKIQLQSVSISTISEIDHGVATDKEVKALDISKI